MTGRPPRAAPSGAGGIAVEQLLSDAMRICAETLGADTCSLMTQDLGGELVVETAYGLDQEVVRDPRSRTNPAIAGHVLASGQPVILGNPLHLPGLDALHIEPRREIKSSICVPIALGEGPLAPHSLGEGGAPGAASGLRGVVSFNRTESPQPFAHADLQLGVTLAAQLGHCIVDARACRRTTKGAKGIAATPACRRLRQDLDNLHRLCDGIKRINISLEPHSIIEQTAQGVAVLTGCRALCFALLQPALGREGGPAAHAGMTTLALSQQAAQAAQELPGPLVLGARRRPRGVVAAGAAGRAHEGAPPSGSAAASRAHAELVAEITRHVGAGMALAVPFADRHSSLGLIVGWDLSRAPGERELALAAGVCAHGAALLRKAMDYQAAVNQRSLELSALYQLCEEISAATTLEAALRSVLEIARSMVRYDEGLVFIWNEETSRLELAACRGADFEATRSQGPQYQPGNMYQWVFAEGSAFISTDIGERGAEGQVLRSSMALPLVVGNETIGVLAMHSALPRAYTEEHVKVLSIVASQAAAIYRALQSLGRLSRYTDKILQSIVAGVIGLDAAGKVVMWSPAAARILGCDAAAAVGVDLPSLGAAVGGDLFRGPASRAIEELGAVARRVLADGEPVLEHELRLERAGQPPGTLLADCTPLRDADGQLVGAVLLLEDVTERNRMQDRMRQMSQLAAVGHLAANVAHEIRNPLSAIKTAAQFLSTEYRRDQLIAQFAGIINEECDRLSKVASDFLTFARPSEPALERICVADVIESALAACGREMKERNVRMAWRRPRRTTPVWADAEAIRQVFVNLLTNAVQAMGDGGEITIRLRSVRAEHDGPAVEAVISDTGPGIAEHDLERIWTPFFSTKAKGTGLGLSIVRKTIEAHGGQVWAEACPPAAGRGPRTGAAFHVRLPTRARGPFGRLRASSTGRAE